MLTVYVKCSSRPAYAERCLWSVERWLGRGGYEVVVLDDGIEDRFLDRLVARRPEAIVRRSLKSAVRRGLAAPPADSARLDPAAFWVEEIGKESNPYILLLEEDTWLTGGFDRGLVLANLARNDVLLLRLFWHGNPALDRREEVFLTAVLDGGTALEYYAPAIRSRLDLYRLFPVALAIYRTDYWVDAYRGIPHWTDEAYALNRATAYVRARQGGPVRPRFAKLEREIIRHSSATTSRSDAGGVGVTRKIDPAPYNRVINEAWLAGELDPLAGYPDDFPPALLHGLFERHLGAAAAAAWADWRADYLDMYARIGCRLDGSSG